MLLDLKMIIIQPVDLITFNSLALSHANMQSQPYPSMQFSSCINALNITNPDTSCAVVHVLSIIDNTHSTHNQIKQTNISYLSKFHALFIYVVFLTFLCLPTSISIAILLSAYFARVVCTDPLNGSLIPQEVFCLA